MSSESRDYPAIGDPGHFRATRINVPVSDKLRHRLNAGTYVTIYVNVPISG